MFASRGGAPRKDIGFPGGGLDTPQRERDLPPGGAPTPQRERAIIGGYSSPIKLKVKPSLC